MPEQVALYTTFASGRRRQRQHLAHQDRRQLTAVLLLHSSQAQGAGAQVLARLGRQAAHQQRSLNLRARQHGGQGGAQGRAGRRHALPLPGGQRCASSEVGKEGQRQLASFPQG